MIEEKFAQGDSFLHRLDGRAKIVTTIAFIVTVSSADNIKICVFAVLMGVIMVLLAKHSMRDVIKRLVLVNSFTLLLWVFLPFSYGVGEPAIEIFFLSIYGSGIQLALLITLKTNAILLYIIAVPCSSTIGSITHSLKRLGLPDTFCFLLLFSVRNIMIMFREFEKLLCAARMRNFTPATNLHTYKTYAHLFAMTLVKSWQRGQTAQEAMLMRGFDGTFRTLENQQLQKNDYLFICLQIMLIFGLLVPALFTLISVS